MQRLAILNELRRMSARVGKNILLTGCWRQFLD